MLKTSANCPGPTEMKKHLKSTKSWKEQLESIALGKQSQAILVPLSPSPSPQLSVIETVIKAYVAKKMALFSTTILEGASALGMSHPHPPTSCCRGFILGRFC